MKPHLLRRIAAKVVGNCSQRTEDLGLQILVESQTVLMTLNGFGGCAQKQAGILKNRIALNGGGAIKASSSKLQTSYRDPQAPRSSTSPL